MRERGREKEQPTAFFLTLRGKRALFFFPLAGPTGWSGTLAERVEYKMSPPKGEGGEGGGVVSGVMTVGGCSISKPAISAAFAPAAAGGRDGKRTGVQGIHAGRQAALRGLHRLATHDRRVGGRKILVHGVDGRSGHHPSIHHQCRIQAKCSEEVGTESVKRWGRMGEGGRDPLCVEAKRTCPFSVFPCLFFLSLSGLLWG